MKKIILLILFALFAPPAHISGAGALQSKSFKEPTGFMDIQFGSSKENAINYFIEKYHMKKDDYGGYSGDNYFSINDYGEFISAPRFCIAETCYNLTLWFGNIDKFYSYSMRTEGVSALEFDTTLQSEVKTLSQIFREKFGEPKTKLSPGFTDIRQGYDSYFWKWPSKRFDIYTALSVYEFAYRASATIEDKKLKSEEAALEEKRKHEKIKSDANNF